MFLKKMLELMAVLRVLSQWALVCALNCTRSCKSGIKFMIGLSLSPRRRCSWRQGLLCLGLLVGCAEILAYKVVWDQMEGR